MTLEVFKKSLRWILLPIDVFWLVHGILICKHSNISHGVTWHIFKNTCQNHKVKAVFLETCLIKKRHKLEFSP